MKMCTFIACLLILAVEVQAGRQMEIVPGKALGDVKIGEASDALKKIGFVFDESRMSQNSYMKRGNLLVRLANDKVAQIWLEERHLGSLRFKGKRLPAKDDIASFKEFFQGCEEFLGSGGTLLYCEHRGIELSFPGSMGPVGFSVVLPSDVEKIVRKPFR